jgi:hypothetical protein
MMPKQPFHDYDPYDHLTTVTMRLEELINQHNRLSQYTELVDARLTKLQADHEVLLDLVRQRGLNN